MALGFGQVRDYVLNELGGESVGDEARLELIMSAALVEISTRLAVTLEQQVSAGLALVDGQSEYPLGGDVARMIELRIAGHVIPRGKIPKQNDTHPSLTLNRYPAFWWHDVDAQAIVLEPATDEDFDAFITYMATTDATLFDIVGDVRVYRTVPLPEETHYSFAEYCTGKAQMRSDPGLAALRISSALGDLDAWKQGRLRSRDRSLALNSDTCRKPGFSYLAWESSMAPFRPNWS